MSLILLFFFIEGFPNILVLQIIGIALVAMTIAWVEKFKGGVEWGNTALGIDFNWHPILMTLSLIFLYGNGRFDQIYQLHQKIRMLQSLFCFFVFGLVTTITFLGALIYRVIPPRDDNHKLLLKCGHAAIMLITFMAMVIGLQVRMNKKNI